MFSGNKPDCVACGFVIVIPENFEVVELLDTYVNYMILESGINTQGIDNVLEWTHTEKKEATIQKILVFLTVSMKKQREAIKDGETNRTGIHSNR